MLNLDSWGAVWLKHLLNPETGKHKLRFKKPNLDSSPNNGFASYEPVWGITRRFYAIYGHNGRFIFQAGSKRWDLTEDNIDIVFIPMCRGAAARIRVIHDGETVHQALLIHPLRAIITYESTFDHLDAEQTHFFFYLSENFNSSSSRKHFVRIWANTA